MLTTRRSLNIISNDIDRLETSGPRSVSVEHVAYETVKEMGLEHKLTELGLTRPQRYVAISMIIGRMVPRAVNWQPIAGSRINPASANLLVVISRK